MSETAGNPLVICDARRPRGRVEAADEQPSDPQPLPPATDDARSIASIEKGTLSAQQRSLLDYESDEEKIAEPPEVGECPNCHTLESSWVFRCACGTPGCSIAKSTCPHHRHGRRVQHRDGTDPYDLCLNPYDSMLCMMVLSLSTMNVILLELHQVSVTIACFFWLSA